MSESCLDKLICIRLNRLWQRIGYCSPRQAFIALCGGAYGGTKPALAMDIEVDSQGELIRAQPTKWEDWIKLPVRECDLAVLSHSGPVRAPLVILHGEYDKMPHKAPSLSTRAILERDGYVDQYSGEKLSKGQASVDHVIPISRGGKNSFDNMVCCEKKRNHQKSNRLNSEVGLKLIKVPKAPRALPLSETIKEARHIHHKPFIQ